MLERCDVSILNKNIQKIPFLQVVDHGSLQKCCDSHYACYPARACVSRSYVIRADVHLYVCIYICVTPPPKKSLNGTLAVVLPFQIFAVDFSLNL